MVLVSGLLVTLVLSPPGISLLKLERKSAMHNIDNGFQFVLYYMNHDGNTNVEVLDGANLRHVLSHGSTPLNMVSADLGWQFGEY